MLLERRTGDNNQLLALAQAVGWPFETKRIRYNQLRHLPPLRSGLTIVDRPSRALIQPPWPDLLICVGYTSVPVARHVRAQSGGRTKLVHMGNPRGKIDDFDLQITTPQYHRPPEPNLLQLAFPIGNPAETVDPTDDELEWLAAFPRPLRLIAVGGPARHWELDDGALAHAIQTIRDKSPKGSMIAVTSGRTRPRTRSMLDGLVTARNEAVVHTFPRFGALLGQADEIYVTADSVSMISEAVLTGKPVGMIPIKRSWSGRLTSLFYEWPTGQAAYPDFRNFWALLDRQQLVGSVEQPRASRVGDTVGIAASAVRKLFSQAGDH